MRPAEVLAVEISQFKNPSGIRMLVPRLFGATEQAVSAKSVTNAPPPRSNDEWLADFGVQYGAEIESVARTLTKIFTEAGLVMRMAATQKSAGMLSVAGHPTTRGLFALVLSPAGLQIAIGPLSQYEQFASVASRANVVKEINALGVHFRTDPPNPANSWPTVPLQTLTDEARLGKLCNYLIELVKRVQSDGTSSGVAPGSGPG